MCIRDSHGGANEAVINMLNEIGGKQNIPGFLSRVKDKQDLSLIHISEPTRPY